jgi:hypothetical protein
MKYVSYTIASPVTLVVDFFDTMLGAASLLENKRHVAATTRRKSIWSYFALLLGSKTHIFASNKQKSSHLVLFSSRLQLSEKMMKVMETKLAEANAELAKATAAEARAAAAAAELRQKNEAQISDNTAMQLAGACCLTRTRTPSPYSRQTLHSAPTERSFGTTRRHSLTTRKSLADISGSNPLIMSAPAPRSLVPGSATGIAAMTAGAILRTAASGDLLLAPAAVVDDAGGYGSTGCVGSSSGRGDGCTAGTGDGDDLSKSVRLVMACSEETGNVSCKIKETCGAEGGCGYNEIKI